MDNGSRTSFMEKGSFSSKMVPFMREPSIKEKQRAKVAIYLTMDVFMKEESGTMTPTALGHIGIHSKAIITRVNG